MSMKTYFQFFFYTMVNTQFLFLILYCWCYVGLSFMYDFFWSTERKFILYSSSISNSSYQCMLKCNKIVFFFLPLCNTASLCLLCISQPSFVLCRQRHVRPILHALSDVTGLSFLTPMRWKVTVANWWAQGGWKMKIKCARDTSGFLK